MTNPFEDPDATYLVLVNDEGQYSLWPSNIPVPGGWEVAQGENSRQASLEFIEATWVDMRPRSLVALMDADAAG